MPFPTLAVYCTAVVFFSVAFHYLKVASTAADIIRIAQQSITTISDNSLDDTVKEEMTQRAAWAMLKCFLIITFKGAMVIVATLIPVLLGDIAGISSLKESTAFALRVDVLLPTGIACALFVFLIRKPKAIIKMPPYRAPNSPYSRLDRAMHNMAFGSNILGDLLSEIESGLFRKYWASASTKQPVFITSLPRAGTTILLEAMYRLPGTATHTYRDMPFVLTPVLWNKLSARIRSKGIMRERAHGDGLIVSADSPEAFEEVFWRKHFPEKFGEDCIELWEGANLQVAQRFCEHIQKIIYIRCPDNMEAARYVSKNNSNIARIKAIQSIFPDAFIVIPLRNPAEHAISLWRQHIRFLERHTYDSFALKYMKDIGHYEFGKLHRPINFPQQRNLTEKFEPREVNYWLAYWISAFEYLSFYDDLIFLSYEALCESASAGFSRLVDHVGLTATASEIENAISIFHKPPVPRHDAYAMDKSLILRAKSIYDELRNRCILA
jgi:hypothetical protein